MPSRICMRWAQAIPSSSNGRSKEHCFPIWPLAAGNTRSSLISTIKLNESPELQSLIGYRYGSFAHLELVRSRKAQCPGVRRTFFTVLGPNQFLSASGIPGDTADWDPVDVRGRLYVNGRVYGFDRATGKSQWPPRRIERQGFDPHQPSGLPIVVFYSQSFERAPNAAVGTNRTSLQCLDRRTGRIVYSEDRTNQPFTHFDSIPHPEEHVIDLKMLGSTVSLTFATSSSDAVRSLYRRSDQSPLVRRSRSPSW